MRRHVFRGAQDLAIVADVSGPGTAPPVLLAHGGGQTRAAWKNTARRLAGEGWQAIAIDQRGHGESAWSPSGTYEMNDFAADLLAVAGQLDRKPAMVGASLGGLAGLIAEDQRPGSFSSLTLVDVTPTLESGGVARVVDFMKAHVDEGFVSVEEAAGVIANYLPHRPRQSDPEGIHRYLRRGDDGRFRWHWDPRFITSIVEKETDYEPRLEAAARRLDLPVHLIRGGLSDLVSESAAARFRELVPDAAYTDIAGAGHMVVGDRNDAFSEAVVNFLRSTTVACA